MSWDKNPLRRRGQHRQAERPGLPLSSIMQQLGTELRLAACGLEAAEQAVHGLVGPQHMFDHNSIRDLQVLDVLQQTLRARAGFVDVIGVTLPLSLRVDAELAVGGITLSALAERLRQSQGLTGLAAQAPSAEPELFD